MNYTFTSPIPPEMSTRFFICEPFENLKIRRTSSEGLILYRKRTVPKNNRRSAHALINSLHSENDRIDFLRTLIVECTCKRPLTSQLDPKLIVASRFFSRLLC